MAPVRIEQTAKKYKAWQAAAILVMILSMVIGIAGLANARNGESSGVLLAFIGVAIGLAVWLVARITAWWNHG